VARDQGRQMNSTQEYIDRADTDEKKGIIGQQWQDAISKGTIVCPCGINRALAVAYRCLYCGVYFCCGCAEKHFGQTIQEWVIAKRIEKRKALNDGARLRLERAKAAGQKIIEEYEKGKPC